ncbi:uncharacterized mitochondrial protein AtMg00810-like [Lathyrus oleraceus]|uniref:uncharacterized mitochondrial protein AtMg00810-like n=1 Tax=Pisum sativum TaxID=3888 RepID=UPI0021D35EA2|nr:uncharacterized mitochondrial protein AtMg00810-like [Pisum sativum]
MEYGVYVQHSFDGNVIQVCLYVDEILLTGSCTYDINKFKKVLMNAFDMTDLENMVYFTGMEILHYEKGIIVYRLKYELELLKRFAMMNYKSVVTPTETNHKLYSDDDGEDVDATTFKQLVSCLRYFFNTRPGICYAVGMMSRFMSKPKWSHYQAAVKILRYVKGTLRYGILFPYGVLDDTELICY